MIITIVRKPLIGSIVENITLHNTGGINIEECRVGNEDTRAPTSLSALGQNSGWNNHKNRVVIAGSANGRWSANVLLSEKDGKVMDKQSGILKSGAMDSITKGGQYTTYGKMYERRVVNPASEGGASRFFKVVEEDD